MNITVNGQEQQVPERLTVAGLLERMKLPPRGVAVEVNLQIVPRARWAEQELAEGDRLEVVTLAGGG